MSIPTPVPNGQQQPQQQQERVMKFISGSLTKEPEVRVTTNGSPVSELNLALDTPKGTFYIKVTVWGTAAYYVCNLKKGAKISAYGQYVQRQYQKNDGTTGVSHELQYASVYLDYGYILESVALMVNQMIEQQSAQPTQSAAQAAQPKPQPPKADGTAETSTVYEDYPF